MKTPKGNEDWGHDAAPGSPRRGAPASWSWVSLLGTLGLFLALNAPAQTTPADLPNLRISMGGEVHAIGGQPDGKIIIAGNFDNVNGVPRTNLARLNPGGSLDLTWNPGCDGVVSNLVVSGSDVFLSGAFTFVGGLSRTNLAKLSTLNSGAADPLWAPQPNGPVHCVALAGTNLFVGGAFTRIGGRTVSGAAKLSTLGTGAAGVWSVTPVGGYIGAMTAESNLVVLAGSFTSVNSIQRRYLARVETTIGAIDLSWDPNPNGLVRSIAQSGNALIVGGDFTRLGGSPSTAPLLLQSNLAKVSLAGAGAADATWRPQLSGGCSGTNVYSVATDGTHVYVTGQFDAANGSNRTGVARFRFSDGQLDAGWFPQFRTFNRLCFFEFCWYPGCESYDGDFVRVRTIFTTPSGLFAGGRFSLVDSQTALGLAKLDATTGSPDPRFPVQTGRQITTPNGVLGQIFSVAVQTDGKLLIGGRFELINGEPRLNLARLETDGTLDPFWQPNPNDRVLAIATQGSDIFVGGDFTWIGGINRSNLAKLSASGTDAADPDWAPDPNSRVSSIAVRGTTLCALGDFTAMGAVPGFTGAAFISTEGTGQWLASPNASIGFGGYSLYGWFANVVMDDTYAYIFGALLTVGPYYNLGRVRIDTGQADLAWQPPFVPNLEVPPGFDNFVESILVSGTNIFIGGYFRFASGQTNLARLDYTTGAPLPGWRPRLSGPLSQQLPPRLLEPASTLLLSGSNLYVGGTFTNVNGTGLSYLARLDALGTGAVDTSWTPQVDAPVYRLVARNNDLFAAGLFSSAWGVARPKLALLATAAAPSLVPRSPTNFLVLRNPLDGQEVTHFRITAITGGNLYLSDGVTRIAAGDFIPVPQGEAGLVFVGLSTGTVTAVSALNATPAGAGTASTTLNVGSTPSPALRFAQGAYSVLERSNGVRVTIQKLGLGEADVQFLTVDGTALAYSPISDTGDYVPTLGTLHFPVQETNRSFTISVVDDQVFKGDRTFFILLANPTGNGRLLYPSAASITLVEDDAYGSTASLTTSRLPTPIGSPPTGTLRVFLEPANAFGQWRLAGDSFWRNQGTSVGGLVTGNYPIEFKAVFGFREPGPETVPVPSGASLSMTRYYLSLTNTETGDLSVTIEPEPVATNPDADMRGEWRKQGEDVWRRSGEQIAGLNAGTHVVEFKPVPNHATPRNQSVVVGANQRNIASGTYLYSSPLGGITPAVLSFSQAIAAEPYLFCGQLETDLGFGSGVVVKERVVLTAAHVLFDDHLLSYVRNARWLFQRHSGDYEPVPQTPRGWYVFEGYAAARTNDLRTGTSPGVSTPQSQAWDAAAVYFIETATDVNYPGRGGYAGYLSSDDLDHAWLVSSRPKMLVGYPLDSVSEVNRGKMHATPATNLSFRTLYGRVAATSDIRSFPGNSGGPLFVEHDNGKFYPAGIYLGGLAQTLVRGIDSQVVDLINRAETAGNGGGNNTGGGVALWTPGGTTSPFVPGLFRVDFAPNQAVARGAAWRVVDGLDPNWIASTNLYYPLLPGSLDIQFKPVPGFITPRPRQVTVAVEQTTVVDVLYQQVRLSNPLRFADGRFQMTLLGETGRVYAIQWSPSLSSWTGLWMVTNRTGSTNLVDLQAVGQNRRFYRAVEQ